MKHTWKIICIAVVLLIVLAGLHYATPGHAPAGQPALQVMNSQALSAMQAEFNRTVSGVRVILLLSPT